MQQLLMRRLAGLVWILEFLIPEKGGVLVLILMTCLIVDEDQCSLRLVVEECLHGVLVVENGNWGSLTDLARTCD